jgi:glycosyltransferase involved in cell wall biosynthesis
VPTVSALIITKNEERNIAECLASVAWTDERIVVDSGSTDKTVALAAAAGAQVFERPWDGFGEAKNFGLQQAHSDWILWIDADERPTPELTTELKEALAEARASVAGYTMPRRANFLGRWIYHCGWYPGRVTRLFRRSKGRFTLHKVHERLELDGQVEHLKSDLLHYTDPDLFHYFEKFNRYTSLAADELVHRSVRFRMSDILVRPAWTFIRMYLIRQGFRDGLAGLILCVVSSVYVFVKYAKLWERGSR